MKIAMIGYGKMGKEIEKIAQERGHTVDLKITSKNIAELTVENLAKCDVAIEFTIPDAAIDNIRLCYAANVPIVVGTTGWLDNFDALANECQEKNQTLFYASNFSVGVNIFFALNKKLAAMMNPFGDYEVKMTEVHHTQKLDAPSGTAITLAEGVLGKLDRKNQWVNETAEKSEDLSIISVREPEVPGTHIIEYGSGIDTIEIKHTAHNRKGFALGAVLASEYVKDKKGVLGMQDMMGDL